MNPPLRPHPTATTSQQSTNHPPQRHHQQRRLRARNPAVYTIPNSSLSSMESAIRENPKPAPRPGTPPPPSNNGTRDRRGDGNKGDGYSSAGVPGRARRGGGGGDGGTDEESDDFSYSSEEGDVENDDDENDGEYKDPSNKKPSPPLHARPHHPTSPPPPPTPLHLSDNNNNNTNDTNDTSTNTNTSHGWPKDFRNPLEQRRRPYSGPEEANAAEIRADWVLMHLEDGHDAIREVERRVLEGAGGVGDGMWWREVERGVRGKWIG